MNGRLSFWERLLKAAKPIIEIMARIFVIVRCAIWIVIEILKFFRGPFL